MVLLYDFVLRILGVTTVFQLLKNDCHGHEASTKRCHNVIVHCDLKSGPTADRMALKK